MVRQFLTNESRKSNYIDIFGKSHILDFIAHNKVYVLLVKSFDFGFCNVCFSLFVGLGYKKINSALSNAQFFKNLLVSFSQRSLYRDDDASSPITFPGLAAWKEKIDCSIQDLLSFKLAPKKRADCAMQVL